jgi:hypothetical protein
VADRYLLETSGVDGYLLEDASGVELLEVGPYRIEEAWAEGSGSTTLAVVLKAAPPANAAIVAWITDPSVSAVRATGSGGGVTWGELANRGNANELVVLAGFAATGAGGTTLTFTFDNVGNHVVHVAVWAGISAMDVTAQTGASLLAMTTPALTPSSTSVLVMGGFDINAAGTYTDAGGGFTNFHVVGPQGTAQVQVAYKIVAGATPQTCTWTQSATNSADFIIMSFLPTAAPTLKPRSQVIIAA